MKKIIYTIVFLICFVLIGFANAIPVCYKIVEGKVEGKNLTGLFEINDSFILREMPGEDGPIREIEYTIDYFYISDGINYFEGNGYFFLYDNTPFPHSYFKLVGDSGIFDSDYEQDVMGFDKSNPFQLPDAISFCKWLMADFDPIPEIGFLDTTVPKIALQKLSPVPEPGTLFLLGVGLVIIGTRFKLRKSNRH